MIDHVSLAVRDLTASALFYEAILAPLGYLKLEARARTIGFGKTYPELWLNLREAMLVDRDSGAHVCLRAPSRAAVDGFHGAALALGAGDDGAPGGRAHDDAKRVYYAAFIKDGDGNRIEAVCFVDD